MAEIFEKTTKKNNFKITRKKYPRIRKNEKFKNWASSCFKLAQIMPVGGVGKREQTDRQTYKIHVL